MAATDPRYEDDFADMTNAVGDESEEDIAVRKWAFEIAARFPSGNIGFADQLFHARRIAGFVLFGTTPNLHKREQPDGAGANAAGQGTGE